MPRNREEWLTEAIIRLRPHLAKYNLHFPEGVKASCGFAGSGSVKKTLGSCWVDESEIFISPIISDPVGSNGVLATLVHELVHASLDKEDKHNKRFKKAAYSVGLEGKPSETYAGSELINGLFKQIVDEIGPYPHIAIELKEKPKGKGSRLLKIECPSCGLTMRITKKWVDKITEEQKESKCWLCNSTMKVDCSEDVEEEEDNG